MLKRVAYITAVTLGLLGSTAHAQTTSASPRSELQMMTFLLGSGAKVGTLVTAGTSITNASTATPFTIAADGALYYADCNAAVHIGEGTAATATITSADYKPYFASHTFFYWHATTTTVAFISADGGAASCAVFKMNK